MQKYGCGSIKDAHGVEASSQDTVGSANDESL